jgi:predicted nucleic acid-binding protein
MTFVLDTSVTMAWCFEDEATAETEAVLDRLAGEEAVVPALWRLEVANVLLVAERRGRMTEARVARFLGLLEQLPIRLDPVAAGFATVLSIGRRHGLSAYDAAYLALAERLSAPIATLDQDLLAASRRAGVASLIG